MPKLTIGMAHYDDYDGVYFTIQAMRMFHPEVMEDVEFVVVDNSPNTRAGKQIKHMMEGFVSIGTAGSVYHPLPDVYGTSISRETIFSVATGDAVLVVDCHVLLPAGSLQRLIKWYDDHPDTRDIYSGPLVYDNLKSMTTHFNDQWRGEMWGTWGSAFKGNCNGQECLFSVVEEGVPTRENPSRAKFVSMDMGPIEITQCGQCEPFPTDMLFQGHSQKLLAMGFEYTGINLDDEPFETPGHGLGLFSCRRDAWLGFNKDAIGFGGEELFIHEKFRQEGGKSICLPFMRWLHRFARPNGVKFPLTRFNKVRNYILEFNELGRDLDPIHEHFVKTGLMQEETWEKLVKDPINTTQEKAEEEGCNTCGGKVGGIDLKNLQNMRTVEEIFDAIKVIPRDLDQHLPKLKELAEHCEHITEFSQRRESTIGFLAGRPSKLVSYNTEWDHVQEHAERMCEGKTKYIHSVFRSHFVDEIEETDLLFIDSTHTYAYLKTEFEKFAKQVKRYIVIHDTLLYGERGEDAGPGKLPAMREFMKANPEWSVIYHTPDQYGLTVMGCQKQDKPKLPSKITMATNLMKAVADHVGDGARKASEETFEKRLLICSTCPQRADTRCTVCGCFLAKKASWKEQGCPIGLWEPEEDVVEETVEKGDQE
tara:strand:- start:8297 stop:10243 length:1947 start_codon:yes stop_codon:yes gene_type:complete